MAGTWLLVACAMHSFGFALFHAGFWRLFGWPRTLQATTLPNRAIVQIANVQLIWVFSGIGLLCLWMPGQLVSTSLGRVMLAGMSGFWLLRTATQLIWLRLRHPLVHVLTALFVLGAGLFAAPLFIA